MAKPKAPSKAQRQKETGKLFAEIREANRDPAFRKAVREFIYYHTH